jgi:citrate/tricarballylate utilization protein
MAQVRRRTYARHAWPRAFGAAYERNGLVVALATAASLALFLVLGAARTGSLSHAAPGGDFYRVFPHGLMVALFAPIFAFSLLALGIGVRRFWRDQAPGPAPSGAIGEATRDALGLRYLDGGHGEGCNEEDDAFTPTRRRAHHLTFYGFALCFAATCVATLYHYAWGRVAPYGYTDLPKLLGIVGGVMLTVGSASLWRLRRRRHPLHDDPAQAPMDRAFIALLFLAATSGLALTIWRATDALALPASRASARPTGTRSSRPRACRRRCSSAGTRSS